MMAMKDEQIRTRAKKKLIRVTFPDGEVICYNNATSTMILSAWHLWTTKVYRDCAYDWANTTTSATSGYIYTARRCSQEKLYRWILQ